MSQNPGYSIISIAKKTNAKSQNQTMKKTRKAIFLIFPFRLKRLELDYSIKTSLYTLWKYQLKMLHNQL